MKKVFVETMGGQLVDLELIESIRIWSMDLTNPDEENKNMCLLYCKNNVVFDMKMNLLGVKDKFKKAGIEII